MDERRTRDESEMVGEEKVVVEGKAEEEMAEEGGTSRERMMRGGTTTHSDGKTRDKCFTSLLYTKKNE